MILCGLSLIIELYDILWIVFLTPSVGIAALWASAGNQA